MSSAIVGRNTELATLDALVRDVAAGRGRAVWIEGEPGIGKSTLLANGLAGAERLGCRLLVLAADELAQRFPLRVLLDGLGARPRSPDPELRAIAELAGGELPGGGTAADPVPAITEQLLTMLDRWCGRSPVVLAMDDIQYADEASLLVWHRLGRVVRQQPLLLVAAARPVPRRPELVRLKRALLAADTAEMPLEPLSPADVVRLAATVAGATTVGPTLRRVLERAAGNPLYVRELVDALDREGRIDHTRDTAELVDQLADIPRSLTATIATRLGFVSGPAMEVLRPAALLGTVFSATDLATVCGRPVPELAPAIDEVMAAGLLVESGSRLAFRHALTREALHEQIPTGLRLALHAHAARALHDAGAAADDVARQLLAALPPDEPSAELPEWVIDWLSRRGRSLAHRSPQVAADLLGHAVRHLPEYDPRREELQVVLAEVLVLLGRHEEVGELAERVLTRTRSMEHAVKLTCDLAWSHMMGARYEQAGEVLRLALRELDAGPEGRALLRSTLARSLLIMQDPLTVEVAERAEAEARAVGDRTSVAVALHILALARHYHRGDPAGALELYDRAIAELGGDAASTDLRLILLVNRSSMLFALGRVAEDEAAMHELLRLAERSAAPPRLATMRLGVAGHYYFRGRWDDALAEIEATLDESDRLATLNHLWQHGITALIAAHRDNPISADGARAMAELPAGPMLTGVEFLLLARAAMAERDGDQQRALDQLRGGTDPVAHSGTRDIWLPVLVRLALATGDRALAADYAKAYDDGLADKAPPFEQAAARRCRGLVDADPEPLLAAVDTYRAAGHAIELANTLEDAAVVLAGQGDRAAARAAYAEAIDVYTRLGAAWDLRRADTRLRPLGLRRQRAPKRRASTGWDALTPTELDVAHLVAQGLANPDIATRLHSSRRTVEVHVSHILTKLQQRSRVDIAREAALHAG